MNWFKRNYSAAINILTAVVVGLILIILINVQSQNAKKLKDNSEVLKNQAAILTSLKQAVNDLKADNERQTRFIGCLLAIHGEGQLVSDDVRAQCQRMSDGIGLGDVSKSPDSDTQTPTPSTSDTHDTQPPPAPQAPQRTVISPVVDTVNGLLKRLGL